MKIITYCISAAFLLAITSLVQGADPGEPSKISEYAGTYRGTLNLAGQASGSTRALFTSSRSKETGNLRLISTITGIGTAVFTETVSIRRNRALYTIQSAGGTFQGRGSSAVTSNVIRYTAVVDQMGTPITVRGTIRRGGRRMSVQHALSGPTTAVFAYSLRKIGN